MSPLPTLLPLPLICLPPLASPLLSPHSNFFSSPHFCLPSPSLPSPCLPPSPSLAPAINCLVHHLQVSVFLPLSAPFPISLFITHLSPHLPYVSSVSQTLSTSPSPSLTSEVSFSAAKRGSRRRLPVGRGPQPRPRAQPGSFSLRSGTTISSALEATSGYELRQ